MAVFLSLRQAELRNAVLAYNLSQGIDQLPGGEGHRQLEGTVVFCHGHKRRERDLALAAVNSPRSEHTIIEGGNHALNNKKQEASEVVFNWLASLSAQRVVV